MSQQPFATLTFERRIEASALTVWQAWVAPAARAIWAPPAPGVTVEFLEADSRIGGQEVSLCKVEGQPDIRVDVRWLDLVPAQRAVNSEVVSAGDSRHAAALVTADVRAEGEGAHLRLTAQIANLDQDMVAGFRQGYEAGIGNLAAVAERTLLMQRRIKAPVSAVWGAWVNPKTLPQWWGPEGFSCRTQRIDLRSGGEWVFDMIAPDGTVFPNHHRYQTIQPMARLEYTLHWGENGPVHAHAWASFEEDLGQTTVTLGMVMASREEYQNAKGFGAEALGLQTLGKLARSIGAE